jgi:hypothetical protein
MCALVVTRRIPGSNGVSVCWIVRQIPRHRRLPAAKTPQAVRLLQQQIDLTDQAIDALVYELYGLTAEEIALVEGGVRS